MAAAAWVAHRREQVRREAEGKTIPPPKPIECGVCHGRNAAIAGDREPCGACGGAGWITPVVPGEADLEPSVLAGVADFLRAWMLIETHGPVGALCLLGEESAGWDPEFLESYLVFEAELGRVSQSLRSSSKL